MQRPLLVLATVPVMGVLWRLFPKGRVDLWPSLDTRDHKRTFLLHKILKLHSNTWSACLRSKTDTMLTWVSHWWCLSLFSGGRGKVCTNVTFWDQSKVCTNKEYFLTGLVCPKSCMVNVSALIACINVPQTRVLMCFACKEWSVPHQSFLCSGVSLHKGHTATSFSQT